ncbi:MAG: DNA repair protein RecO [Armatimonadota bacterium]
MPAGTMPRVYRTEAVVIRRVNTGETDRVLTLFTRDLGKISAIAKGARGPRSRLSAVTEPFTYFRGLMAKGQTLDVLTQAEVQSSFPGIRKDLTRIGYASYFVELVDAGTEERQESPELWDVLLASLAALETAATPDVLARAFELHAMRLLGYEPSLFRCALCQGEVGVPGTGFHPTRGGIVCPRCARTPGTVALSPPAVTALSELTAVPLAAAASSGLPERTRGELARSLVPFVRHHVEKGLRSLEFLDDLAMPTLPEE